MSVITLEEFQNKTKKKKKNQEEKGVMTLEEYLGKNKKKIAETKKTTKKSKEDEEDDDKWFKSGAFEDGYQFGDFTKTTLGTVGDITVNVGKGVLGLVEGVTDLAQYGAMGITSLFDEDKAQQIKQSAMESWTDNLLGGMEKSVDKYSVLGNKSDNIAQGIGYIGGILATGGIAGATAGASAGASALIPTLATTGVTFASSMGGGMGEAYQSGASDFDAVTYGAIKGIADAGTELIFGGLGKAVGAVGLSSGISALDDVFAQKLSSKVTSQVAKNFIEFGVKAGAEGTEEVMAGVLSAIGKKVTYMEDEELAQLVEDEKLLDQFIAGAITSGFAQSGYIPGMTQGSLREANKTGRDFISGYNQNEQGMIDTLTEKKVTESSKQKAIEKEVEKAIAERETSQGGVLSNANKEALKQSIISKIDNGEIDISSYDLSKKERSKIQKEVEEDLKSGKYALSELEDLSTAETTSKIKELEEQLENAKTKEEKAQIENAIEKLRTERWAELQGKAKENKFLAESVYDKTQEYANYTYDKTKVKDTFEQETRDSATTHANNTKKTRQFVDSLSKLAKAKQTSIRITNNQELLEQGDLVKKDKLTTEEQAQLTKLENELANARTDQQKQDIQNQIIELTYMDNGGLVRTDANGKKTILVNIDSKQAMYEVVGHETRHLLEADNDINKTYNEKLFAYAETQGDLEALRESIKDTYNTEDVDLINSELSAKLTGKYLFENPKFLETIVKDSDQSTAQKIVSKIKEVIDDLIVHFKGTEQEKQLREIQKNFKEMYKQYSAETQTETEARTQYSIAEIVGDNGQSFGIGVRLDSTLLDGLSPKERVDMIKEYVHELGGSVFTAYDSKGNKADIRIAEKNERFKNKSGKKIPVNKNLTNKFIDSETKQEAITLIDELVETAEYTNSDKSRYTHDWLDNNGANDWEYWDTYVEDKNGDIWKVTLNVANTTNGEKVLYDINKIKKVGQSIGLDTSTTSTDTISEVKEDVKRKYSLSLDSKKADQEYLSAVKTGDNATAQKMVDEVAKEKGYTIKAYHGTNADFFTFDKGRVGKGTDQYGAGFYFASDKSDSKHYGSRVIDSVLKLENPYTISSNNLLNADITLTEEEAYEVVKRHPMIYDADESPLGDFYDSYWEDGAQEWMIQDLATKYTDLGYLDSDLFRDYPNELHEAIRDVTGHDGLVVELESGDKFYIAWFDNQMKTSDVVTRDEKGNVIPLSERFDSNKNDIRYSLSNTQDIAPVGNRLQDLRVKREIAPPVPNQSGEVTEMVGNAPSIAPSVTEQRVQAENEALEEMYAPVTEEEANAMLDSEENFERTRSLQEAEEPLEIEDFDYDNEVEVNDPFDSRDIKDVGKRNVNAYMYDNPEVKPFYQEEARIMLGELQNTVKGERFYNDQLYYDTNGEQGFSGTSRMTSDEIAELLDNYNYSYADIEKGLKAIIEDHGAENIAVAKRIEFFLNERLLNGHTDFQTGIEIPRNQQYVNVLEGIQVNQSHNIDDLVTNEISIAPPVVQKSENIPQVRSIAPSIAESNARVEVHASQPLPLPQTEEVRGVRMNAGQPRQDNAQGNMRRWVGTSTDSEVVNREILPSDLDQSKIYYEPISNKKTLNTANADLDRMGYDTALEVFNAKLENRTVSLSDIALGERLVQESLKRGDTKTTGELIQNIAILGTELGQKVQALSIIQRMTPEGQLKMLQKVVNRGKAKGDPAFKNVEITQEMIDKILAVYGVNGTYDQNKLNEAVERVKQDIADQMEVTKMDKVNAWRYLAMLGNPKTHIRNVVSNVTMQVTTEFKNAIARTVESIAPVKNRTKTWEMATDVVKDFAKQSTIEAKAMLTSENSYSESADIKAKRDVFEIQVLQKAYDLNNDLMTKEDWFFKKSAYRRSLQEFLTANGIKTQEDIQNNPELIEKGKKYATEQAQIATFQQVSWLANEIRKFENKNVVTQIGVGAVIPFKKTPINIAKTGLAYSPLGFAKSLSYDLYQMKQGNLEASQVIDNFAKGLTGSALVYAGYMFAMSGLLNGGGEEDKEGKYDYQLGEQYYSLNIGGNTYTLNWLSPVAMPLFVGANLHEAFNEDKEFTWDTTLDSLSQTLDPMTEMSFLSGLTSVLSSYEQGTGMISAMAETMLQNYATQFVPTLLGQVAQVTDDKKRSTAVSGDSTARMVEQTINKLKYKIPGLRQTLEPTLDIWGNETKQTENLLTRTVESFIAPYTRKDVIATEIDLELKDLYSQTGDNGVIPSVPTKKVKFKGDTYKMSADEYTDYKKVYGELANETLEDLFKTNTYKNSDADYRAELVNRVYQYARDEAKKDYLAKEGVEYTNTTQDNVPVYKTDKIKGAIENDMTLEEFDLYSKSKGSYYISKLVGGYESYKTYSDALNDIGADKNANGQNISNSKKAKVVQYINNLDTDYYTKIMLMKKEYPADDTYNYEIVEYLNSREDISYQEMVDILTELDFKVSADGTIRW